MSTLTDGQSQTVIEFRLEVNTDRAVNDVKDAIAKIRADLPRTIDEPIIQRIDVEGQSILSYGAFSAGMTLEQLSWHVDDVVARELQGLKGWAGSTAMAASTGKSASRSIPTGCWRSAPRRARSTARSARPMSISPAGAARSAGRNRRSARSAGARTVAELAETKITLSGGREVRLKELGRVEDSNSEPRSFGRLDKSPVVSFAVFRSKGSSELSVKEVVAARIAELNKRYPDITLKPIDDAVAYTYGNYKAAMMTLLEGAALAVLVVFLFLKNWRATLITAIALPLSAIPTFWAMELMGFSLNLVSLLGITLVTGIPGRRRHRRDREHRPAHADGEIALSRRDGGRRRDRPGRHRDHAHHRRDLCTRLLHGRRGGAVFPPVRAHGGGGGAVLAARGAADHADDGGLSDEAGQA